MLLLALAYRVVYTIVGGHLTATLAPTRPMRHVVALIAVGLVLGALGSIAMWGIAPAWFTISIVVLGPPTAWLGGRLRAGPRP